MLALKFTSNFPIFVLPYREREQQNSSAVPVKRRTPLRRLKVSPRLPVPDHIQKPPYVSSKLLPEISSEFQIHDEEGIARMRAACELAARVLEHAGTLVRVRTKNLTQSPFPLQIRLIIPKLIQFCNRTSHQ